MPNWAVVERIVEIIILPALGWFLKDRYGRRPRLIRYALHPSAVIVKQTPPLNDFAVHVHALVVHNAGRGPATNVRIGHTFLPNFSVYPDLQYSVEKLPSGGMEIVLPLLPAGQDVLVQYLYYPPLVWTNVNTHVHSDETTAKAVNMWHVRKYSMPVNVIIAVLMLIGAVTISYFVWAFGTRVL